MIFTYNRPYVGDVLMVVLADNKGQKATCERRGDVAVIRTVDDAQVIGVNIFNASQYVTLKGQGQVFLDKEEVNCLNALMSKQGFEGLLSSNDSPCLVIGEIIELLDHPDSDHLHVCQVAIGQKEPVQVVCGAPNATKGLKTVVALPGTMMPDGSLIFSGELRGEKSFGMLCSARELALPNAPQVRGIIELSGEVLVGQAFDPAIHWKG